MRRHDREVTDSAKIAQIIAENRVLRLAMVENGAPYIVPMNYGFSIENDKYIFYIHSATAGRKVEILQSNPQVAIEIDDKHQLTGEGDACEFSYNYRSIIAEGTAGFITDTAEKIVCLQKLMFNHTGSKFEITEKHTVGVALIRIEITNLSCKINGYN
ncbi:MAG: pyridoxamine 5'-phosphate oxidase family protein [Bacillota bacterium]